MGSCGGKVRLALRTGQAMREPNMRTDEGSFLNTRAGDPRGYWRRRTEPYRALARPRRCSTRVRAYRGWPRRGAPTSSASGDGVYPPSSRDALELVLSAIDEIEARAGDEIPHGLRDQHLP
jgi:hypothetical protein